MLPDSFKQLTLLQHLNLEQCTWLTLQPDILENMTRVHYLNLTDCWQLEELPHHITNQASLSELYVKGTKLRVLPTNIGHLSKLRVMNIGLTGKYIKMQSLPDSMGNLTLLQKLELSNIQMQTLPDFMESFILLEELGLCKLKLQSLPNSFKQLISLRVLKIEDCPMNDLDFGQTFLGSNLKTIELTGTRVPKITMSDGSFPHLRNLKLERNDHLTEVNTLPTTLKDISVSECGLLRNMSGIGGLVSLQYLRLKKCPGLKTLPSFRKLASLKEFDLIRYNKVKMIEGLEECTSLERLVIDGGQYWDVSGTKRLGHLERLKEVQLVAKKRSTLLPCIEMIQKWPEEMIICTKASAEAGSLLKSSAFPDLSDVQFFAKDKFKKHIKRFSDVKAMIVCYVIKCNWLTSLRFDSPHTYRPYKYSNLEEGKWVWMGAFTEQSTWFRVWMDAFRSVELSAHGAERECEMFGIGDEGSLVKAFHRLLPLLAA